MLSRTEFKSLLEAFAETCRFIADLQARNPAALHIQRPKIPTLLSESLAVYALEDGKLLPSLGAIHSVERAGHQADILVVLTDGRPITIELKASGQCDFACFGPRDYTADYLLWLRFGAALQDGTLGEIEVLICQRPEDHLPWKRNRVTVGQLLNAWQGEIGRVRLNVSDYIQAI